MSKKDFHGMKLISTLKNNLYIMRHGFSEANESNLIVSSPENGLSAYGLSIRGKQEISDSLIQLKKTKKGVYSYLIISSPFLRCVETTLLIKELLQTEDIFYDNRLCERYFGSFELSASSNYERVWEKDFLNPYHKTWGVESVFEVSQRVTEFLKEINEKYSGKNIFIVSHGDVCQIIIANIFGKGLRNHRKNTSLMPGEIREIHMQQK